MKSGSRDKSDGSSNLKLSSRLRRGDVFSDACPSRNVLLHATSRWGVLVLVALRDGMHRFSDLRRKIKGISEKMLAQTLKSLESDGFVKREAKPVVPPHVEYTLTPMGEEIGSRVEELADWIELNLPRILDARSHSDFDRVLPAP